MNNMYNMEIKEEFLRSQYSEDTAKIARYVFYYSYLIEKTLNKDVFEFTIDELGSVIANSNPTSIVVARSRGSIISQYLNWAYDNNYRVSNINPLQNITDDWYSQFIDKNIKQFISIKELNEIVSGLVNYQDKIIPVLLFHGVYGTQSSEIRNLKLSDIQADGTTVRLYDDRKGERFITLDKEVIEMLIQAANESSYYHKNGLTAISRWAQSDLLESDYIVKMAKKGRGSEGKRVSQTIIIKRVDLIAEYFGMPDLTPKSINRSGMLYYASKLIGVKEKLSQQDFNVIGDRFNLTKMESNGHIYYNSTYLSSYINKENIDRLYGTN
ncbi:tyrosine-type recombinase/integrase [Robertmurraya siralis]|uniref:tyrosine-type recombinase/integrase n=1 Tax=Robertmurraya siralis TaxID=77777 RepID=UPI0010F5B076|nr:site-specific integrase [Robertmurraya siralis]